MKKILKRSYIQIEHKICSLRGMRVMLDSDLAKNYDIKTSRLNEQVKRNIERFPEDFCFLITEEELSYLISQNAISISGHGGRRKLPYVFTEHGALMAAKNTKNASDCRSIFKSTLMNKCIDFQIDTNER